MKVLVTGANGFVGTHLVEELICTGKEVIPFDIPNGDLRSEDALSNYSDVDYLFHLAGKTFVPESWSKSFDCFDNNIISAVTVLEFCRKNKCGLTLMSTYLYGNPRYLPIDEDHPLDPVSPYHESKLIIESLAQFYSKSFGLNITIFRPFNIYGEGQNKQFLIPKIVSQITNEKNKEIVINDLAPKRDYVYIKDVVKILSMACEKQIKGMNVYNIGTGHSISVREVIETVEKVMCIEKPYRETGEKREREIPDCVASTERLSKHLGFTKFCSFEEGLKDWLKI